MIDAAAGLAGAAPDRRRRHDPDRAAPVADIGAGAAVGRLDAGRPPGAHVDSVDRKAVGGATDQRTRAARFGHIFARHQHRALGAAEPVDDRAVILPDPSVVERAALAEQLRIAALEIDRDEPRERDQEAGGRVHRGDLADQPVVGGEIAPAQPLRIAVRTRHLTRPAAAGELVDIGDRLAAGPGLHEDDPAAVGGNVDMLDILPHAVKVGRAGGRLDGGLRDRGGGGDQAGEDDCFLHGRPLKAAATS